MSQLNYATINLFTEVIQPFRQFDSDGRYLPNALIHGALGPELQKRGLYYCFKSPNLGEPAPLILRSVVFKSEIKSIITAGTRCDIELLILGPGLEHVRQIAEASSTALWKGLGGPLDSTGRRGSLYTHEIQLSSASWAPIIETGATESVFRNGVILKFVSPLAIKMDDTGAINPLSLVQFRNLTLARFGALGDSKRLTFWETYGEGQSPCPTKEFWESLEIYWHSFQELSWAPHQHDGRVVMNKKGSGGKSERGLSGTFSLSGNLLDLLPLLRLASSVGIGLRTNYGMGQFEIFAP
jgi:hypothetical protein